MQHARHHSLPQPIRFGILHRRWLYGSFALLWASGVAWLILHYFFTLHGPFGPTPHPLAKWALRLHGLAGFNILVSIGTVLPVHARRAWNLRKNRNSGTLMQLTLLWLALTAYALYYFIDEDANPWLPWLHWLPGLLLPLLLSLHVWIGRKRARVVAHTPKTYPGVATATVAINQDARA
jgi:hypothetical protein